MADPVRVRMAMDLFVEDEQAMREAALERLRDAWNADEDFPYAEASDVPFDQVVNSVVANALPLEFPGGRRGQLSVETQDDDGEAASDDDQQNAESTDGTDDEKKQKHSDDEQKHSDDEPL